MRKICNAIRCAGHGWSSRFLTISVIGIVAETHVKITCIVYRISRKVLCNHNGKQNTKICVVKQADNARLMETEIEKCFRSNSHNAAP